VFDADLLMLDPAAIFYYLLMLSTV
jgi:hypothetical protein